MSNKTKNIKHTSISEKTDNTAKIFTSRNRVIFFVFEEIVLIFLIILQIFFILDIKIINGNVSLFGKGIVLQSILWLVASIMFYIIIYVGVVMRDKQVQKVHKEVIGFIFSTSKEKIIHANRRIIVLMFAELFFILTLAISIYLYLDPEINLFPYPTNILTFIVILISGHLIFSTTKDFRQKTYGRGKIQKKLFKEEGTHILKRTTKKRKMIRVGSKIKKNK